MMEHGKISRWKHQELEQQDHDLRYLGAKDFMIMADGLDENTNIRLAGPNLVMIRMDDEENQQIKHQGDEQQDRDLR